MPQNITDIKKFIKAKVDKGLSAEQIHKILVGIKNLEYIKTEVVKYKKEKGK